MIFSSLVLLSTAAFTNALITHGNNPGCAAKWVSGTLTVTNISGVQKEYKPISSENAVMLELQYMKSHVIERFKYFPDSRSNSTDPFPQASWQLITPGMTEEDGKSKYDVFYDNVAQSAIQDQTVKHNITTGLYDARFFYINTEYVKYQGEVSDQPERGDGFLVELLPSFDPNVVKVSGGLCAR